MVMLQRCSPYHEVCGALMLFQLDFQYGYV